MQKYLSPNGNYWELDCFLAQFQRVFLVCVNSAHRLPVGKHLETLERQRNIQLVRFNGFAPNPDWEDIEKGVRFFQDSGCSLIAAVGGGSAIDTAKCIRDCAGRSVSLLAIPTTAGSGSEATHFAVAYRKGIKESVDCGLPDAVLLDPSALDTLPLYQRKATMLDALCHGIESFWSVRATRKSQKYSQQAVRQIMEHYEGYLKNTPEGNAGMLEAAHLAGMAINIAQTTAGHAMCYQLTKLYGLAHGHAAALCVSKLWPWLLDCGVDLPEGLAVAMGRCTLRESAERFQAISEELELEVPVCTEEDLATLIASVNAERMKNLPAAMTTEDIGALYREIVCVRR